MKYALLALALLTQTACSQEIPPTAEIGPPPWEIDDTVRRDAMTRGRDYGVQTSALGHGPKIRASDPDTLARVREEQRKCPGPNCPNPSKPDEEKKPAPPQGPIKRIEQDISFAATMIVASLLFLAGFILLTRRKS
jgi:hypothetical protein